MIPHHTLKAVRTHKNLRTLRSLRTPVGPARGTWTRVRESEELARRERPDAGPKSAPPARPVHH
jgi:hypothetical protein